MRSAGSGLSCDLGRLELKRNIESASTFASDRSAARQLAQDATEFLSSVVTFDAFDAFSELSNERLLIREASPEKMAFIARSLEVAIRDLGDFLDLLPQDIVAEATALVNERL